MANAWMVRAGAQGEREQEALNQGLVIAGWPEMGDLSQFATRKDLRVAVRSAYPDRSSTVVANWTGQLWRLVHDIEDGDLVVIPLKTVADHIAIGRIAGPYRYSEASDDWPHVRPVEWIRKAVPRPAVQQDLLYSLGSLLTICQLRRNGAARRIAALAETGTDPGPTPEDLSSSEWVTPTGFLERALAAEDGLKITVRELLAEWGAFRRTAGAVAAIQSDLSDSTLTTVPVFTEAWIDDTITVIRTGADSDDPASELLDEPASTDEDDDDEPAVGKPFTLRFGNFVRAGTVVVSVRPSDTLALAQTLLLRYDFSQLAVVDEEGTFRGAISWETIAKTAMAKRDATLVSHATQIVAAAEHGEPVLPRLEEISNRGFVFVRSTDGKAIAGIVTSADLTDRFGEIAKPFSMIEECELRLRRRVAARMSDEIVAKATNKRCKSVDRLTLGAYPHLLAEQEHFDMLGWPLDRRQFVAQISSVAKIRNGMMHFSPDPVPTRDWGEIDGLLAMLRAVDPIP